MTGDVHVVMTEAALARAGAAAAAAEHVRGVLWNDDPEGFAEAGDADIAAKVFAAQEDGATFGPGDSLFARGHFGDLQFIHAMACAEDEAPETTLAGMLAWCELMHGIAAGDTGGGTPLDEAPVAAVAERFAGGPPLTVAGLLRTDDPAALRARAAGSLLHVVQDSFASAHVERIELGGARRGPIVRFLWYGGQDPLLHARADAFPGPGGLDRLHTVGGALDGLDRSVTVLELLGAQAAWEPVEELLRGELFALSPDVRPAAAGAEFAVRSGR
jgi:hypothetical protein